MVHPVGAARDGACAQVHTLGHHQLIHHMRHAEAPVRLPRPYEAMLTLRVLSLQPPSLSLVACPSADRYACKLLFNACSWLWGACCMATVLHTTTTMLS